MRILFFSRGTFYVIVNFIFQGIFFSRYSYEISDIVSKKLKNRMGKQKSIAINRLIFLQFYLPY